MRESSLFTLLPEDYVCTPDGMAIDANGDLILSCPNYAQDDMSGCIVRIDRQKHVRKWFDVPRHPETGVARNMGIEFDQDGYLYICDNQGWKKDPALQFKGRVLKIKASPEGVIEECIVVADQMEHPNGIRIRGSYMYVTQSKMTRVADPQGRMISGVYRFRLDEHDVHVKNALDDPNLYAWFITENLGCRYGADGIAFNSKGELFIGNFGDGEIRRILMNPDGSIREHAAFAKNPEELVSTDGMIFDDRDNLYIADFRNNAIVKMTPEGKLARLAQSPDCDGFNGELDQPGEPIIWQGKLIASCFDLSVGPGKVNTAHEMPATMAEIEI